MENEATAKTEAPTPRPLSTQEFLNAIEQIEKRNHEHIWRLEQRLTELSQRVLLLEEPRDREFNIELQRRVQLSGGGKPKDYGAEAQESVSSRLRRSIRTEGDAGRKYL